MKTKTAILITALILVIALLSGCGTLGPGSAQEENLGYPTEILMDRQVGHSGGNRSERIIEFVPKGEKIDNWTRLVTVKAFKKSAVSAESLETLVNRMAKEMSAQCPETVWNVIERGPNTILYEFRVQNCRPEADQHEIARVLEGKYNRFYIAYAAKVKSLPPEERDKWIKLLSEASIVNQ